LDSVEIRWRRHFLLWKKNKKEMDLICWTLPALSMVYSLLRTDDEKQRSSILTWTASLVLSVTYLMDEWILTSRWSRFESWFYLSYTVLDMCFAACEYPHYFPFLSGTVHHLFSGAIVIYNIVQGRPDVTSHAFVVEIPTIVLTARRVFPECRACQWLYRRTFPTLFVTCRLIGLTYTYYTRLADVPLFWDHMFFPAFLMLNTYWTFLLFTKPI